MAQINKRQINLGYKLNMSPYVNYMQSRNFDLKGSLLKCIIFTSREYNVSVCNDYVKRWKQKEGRGRGAVGVQVVGVGEGREEGARRVHGRRNGHYRQ